MYSSIAVNIATYSSVRQLETIYSTMCGPCVVAFLIGRLYSSDTWQGLLLRTNVKEACVEMRMNFVLNT